MQKLTPQQRKLLEKSPHVVKTTDSHVIYTENFKLKAVGLFDEGMSASEIFERHGLKFDFFNEYYFTSNLKRWRKARSHDGEIAIGQRGRPKKPANFSVDNLSMDDLKALVQIQSEVIEALKKKKALVKKK